MAIKEYPEWFRLGESLMWPLVGMAVATCRSHKMATLDLSMQGELAIYHHAGCLETSAHANKRGKHSAALCLIRQSVEALCIAELSLQDPSFAEPLLLGWKDGKKTQGEVRKSLERDIWPRYGSGLWSETWPEFYANLARAVQPYAHYTSDLQGWQFSNHSYDGGTTFLASTGLENYDSLLATRITLLHALLTWMLGRILLDHGKNTDVLTRKSDIHDLGKALGSSRLLFEGGDWGSQLAPHMFFKPGQSWGDES